MPCSSQLPVLLFTMHLCIRSVSASVSGPNIEGWTRCGRNNSVIRVSDVVVSPQPVEPGKVISINVSMHQSRSIEGGKLTAAVRYVGVPVYKQSGDLCDALSCPSPAGDGLLMIQQFMPRFIPRFGSLVLRLSAESLEGDPLLCIDINLSRNELIS